MLASSTVYTVVTRLVIRVPSTAATTADNDTGRLHCLPGQGPGHKQAFVGLLHSGCLPSGFDGVCCAAYTIEQGPDSIATLCDSLSPCVSPVCTCTHVHAHARARTHTHNAKHKPPPPSLRKNIRLPAASARRAEPIAAAAAC